MEMNFEPRRIQLTRHDDLVDPVANMMRAPEDSDIHFRIFAKILRKT